MQLVFLSRLLLVKRQDLPYMWFLAKASSGCPAPGLERLFVPYFRRALAHTIDKWFTPWHIAGDCSTISLAAAGTQVCGRCTADRGSPQIGPCCQATGIHSSGSPRPNLSQRFSPNSAVVSVFESMQTFQNHARLLCQMAETGRSRASVIGSHTRSEHLLTLSHQNSRVDENP